jgi:heme/copper-type cytochrome/quinol oxidase subunit 2
MSMKRIIYPFAGIIWVSLIIIITIIIIIVVVVVVTVIIIISNVQYKNSERR